MKEGTPDRPVPIESKRVPLEREVVLRFPHFKGFIAEYSGNISMGGMFIRSEGPKPPGSEFSFELGLQDGFPLVRGRAVVVWTRAVAEGPGRPAGMGVRFVEIDDSSRRLIQRVVEEWVKEGGDPFDLETAAPVAAAPADDSLAADEAPPVEEALPPDEPPPAAEPEAPAAPRFIGVESIGEARVGPSPSRREGGEPPALSATPSVTAAATEPGAWTPPTASSGSTAAAAARGAGGARRSRGRRALLAMVALAVVLAIAAGLFWRRRAGNAAPPGSVVTEAVPDAPSSLPGPVVGEAEGATPASPGGGGPGVGEPPHEAATGSSSAPAAGGAPAALAVPETAAAESAATPRPLAAVRDIRWRREGVALVVEIVTEGGVAAGDFVATALGGGDSPRYLVRLLGVGRPFERSSIAVGEPEVERVRTGYHQLAGSNELHVVFDLAGAGVEVSGAEPGPGLLRVRFRAAA